MHAAAQQKNGAVTARLPFAARRSGEQGYTLVALLALMAVMMIFAAAVAPSVRQQSQRELEKEAMFRGEEVAYAIRLYVEHYNRFPTSIDQLLEGIPQGTKKRQILRPVAAIDPLSTSGEWKLVKDTDQRMVEFQRSVFLYTNGALPVTSSKHQLFQQSLQRFNMLINTKSEDDDEPALGGEDESANSTGPFIGVSSRSRRDAVITYYGIDRHDEWVFTPLFR